MILISYLKTKTLLKNCHIILYWTQQFSIPGVVSWSWSAPVHPQCQRSLPDPQPGVHARSLAGDCFPIERLGHDRSRCWSGAGSNTSPFFSSHSTLAQGDTQLFHGKRLDVYCWLMVFIKLFQGKELCFPLFLWSNFFPGQRTLCLATRFFRHRRPHRGSSNNWNSGR